MAKNKEGKKNYKISYRNGISKVTGLISQQEYEETKRKLLLEDDKAQIVEITKQK